MRIHVPINYVGFIGSVPTQHTPALLVFGIHMWVYRPRRCIMTWGRKIFIHRHMSHRCADFDGSKPWFRHRVLQGAAVALSACRQQSPCERLMSVVLRVVDWCCVSMMVVGSMRRVVECG